MENQAAMEQQSYEDVRKSGYLRKQKSMHRRFFVLRAASEQGPARLEYYENEKKFRSKSPVPKKAVNLDSCFNINKRADSKNKYMIVLYTRGESFAIAADTEDVQNEWYQAMLDLQCKCKTPDDCGSGGDCGLPSPGPAFKEVWQVKVWPKGLGQARNLVGIYRLCLTDKTVNFVKLNSDVAAVVLQLMNVRRCGHSENFFFIEVGRSAMTGPGEFWMQVEDSVVAQNMHETLLEAMKALSEEFRQRSKSQTVGVSCGGGTASNPISVPSRRHHPNLPPSQVGFSRRARTETPGVPHSTNTSPTPRQGFSRSRTASIGARTEDGGGRATALSTSPSLNGSSCSTTPTLRPKPTRAPTPAKITLSLARYTPNPAPSPAPSLSSSSGHGSECGLSGAPFGTVPICTYARIPQRVSMSGSPSDYGSSDEYGSSPGEHSLLAAGIPAALVEGGASYILMGHREGSHKRAHGRRVFRRSSNRECEAERRLLSKRASLPPTIAQEHLVPRRREEEDEENYAVMSHSASRESFTSRRGSGSSATTSLVQETSADKGVSTKGGPEDSSIDSGYMSMLPGVTAPASLSFSVSGSDAASKGGDEYMAMTPNNSVSPPQHIRLPISEGYMMMSPNSSCSPDLHGMSGCIWGSRGSMESRAGSDYMNMSPISARSACSTPPSHPEQQPLQPKMVYSYFSLPRSYKHTALSTRFEEDLDKVCIGRGEARRKTVHSGYPCGGDTPVGSGGGGQLSLSSSSFSSSSASSESLEDRSLSVSVGGIGQASRLVTGYRVGGPHPKVPTQHHHQQRCGPGIQKQGHLQKRKDKSFFVDMSKANTLPRVRETLLPTATQSPGEYVSIVYQGERGGHNNERNTADPGNSIAQGNQAYHRSQSCKGATANLPRSFSALLSTSISLSSEYVNMDLGNSYSSLTPLSSFKPAQKVREDLTRASKIEQKVEIGLRKSNVTSSEDVAAAPFTDYTEMKFGLAADNTSKSPKHGQTPQPSSMEQERNMNFSSPKAFSNVDQGARVVRAESSARRRHRSETFMAPSTLPLSPSTSPSFPETPHGAPPRQQGLESNLRASGRPTSPQCPSPGAAALPGTQSSPLSLEQGLNYIDLDLVSRENSQTSGDGPSGLHSFFSPVVGGGLSGGLGGAGGNTTSSINTYASIDFIKSEEMRVHQNSRKDSKDC
ncbi:insulin receptor substrate 1-B [Triplophysa rosa]|uniref:Insulin receptor substrate 1-B n=1 Tax=Triplophysa rosa TaxID=992332 RepID=A0A9W7X2R5_TRIRA|nr:insulin receptor substrate 1-B [Triplophysa rosa]KAI7812948.1 putative insulin receptor substrate 1-B [Triplophysa rosa]